MEFVSTNLAQMWFIDMLDTNQVVEILTKFAWIRPVSFEISKVLATSGWRSRNDTLNLRLLCNVQDSTRPKIHCGPHRPDKSL